jgi:hypothetical protein
MQRASTVGRPDGVAMPGRHRATPPSGGSAATRRNWAGPSRCNIEPRHCRQAAHAWPCVTSESQTSIESGPTASPNAEREMAGRPKAARSPTGKVRWIPRLSYSRSHSARIAIARAVTLQARRSLPLSRRPQRSSRNRCSRNPLPRVMAGCLALANARPGCIGARHPQQCIRGHHRTRNVAARPPAE